MTDDRLTPQQQFIVDLYPAAMRVSKETGMSWELILAQAAQETGWGEKVLPGTHNIFNIKATAGWHGQSRTFNVPEYENGRKVWLDQDFRVYASTEGALRDRVAFLRNNPRYAQAGLFDAGTQGDMRLEAAALQRAGYATDPAYAVNLERVFRGPTMQHALELAGAQVAIRAPASPQAAIAPAVHSRTVGDRDATARAAILTEADRHFLRSGDRFEYGRSDMERHNGVGNLRTDRSRTEQDLDHDGYKGVDCSSLVWRGLKDAGYGVPAAPFTTHDLFQAHAPTPYARQHFDVIPAQDARAPNGSLQPGDILMFKDRFSSSQHVAIFKGYDANGHIQFIGSQVGTGPAAVTIAPHSYWDGHNQEIVGALRAKPGFHVHARLHAEPAIGEHGGTPARRAHGGDQSQPSPGVGLRTNTAASLAPGEHGTPVARLQSRLFELGYRGEDGRPLGVDGEFGRDTSFALKQFQREHGLEGKGVAGPKTEAALARAERSLMADPSHPQHALFEQAVAKVAAAERAQGTAVGPHTRRIAAALTVECVREGITRIDRVEINDRNTLARAVENRPNDREAGLGITDAISLAQASRQPIAESSRQAHEVAVNVRARQQDHDLQMRRTAPVPAL
ncbi:glucosaminidase domain-containing protein [Cognatilysobacter lacus]|uniref:glucosaminidase domain-containing protein n=1 Tax=Cognatilysobacter lacus TaxID=1643323 RepID=UPI001658F96F|nr:glucosaminidase domain-containing protein [Lysobacter lacus]